MLGVALNRDGGVVTAIFCVCSGLLILHVSSTPDAKIVNISHRDVWVVSHRNVWVGTYF